MFGVVYLVSLFDLIIIAVSLSMDAFAVAVCTGLSMRKATLLRMLIVGLWFGVFQAGMPLIGYAAATFFAERIIEFDHWIAFGLLSFLGAKMIFSALKKNDSPGSETCSPEEARLTPAKMLPLAVATSIDALAIGVTLAFLQVDIVPAVALIGIITLLLSMLGVKIGSVFGMKFKSKAEFAGGVILVLMGVRILLEHLGVVSF